MPLKAGAPVDVFVSDPRFEALSDSGKRVALHRFYERYGAGDGERQFLEQKGFAPTLSQRAGDAWNGLGQIAQDVGKGVGAIIHDPMGAGRGALNQAVQSGSFGIVDTPSPQTPGEKAGSFVGDIVGGAVPALGAFAGPGGLAAAYALHAAGNDARAQAEGGKPYNFARGAVATAGGLLGAGATVGTIGKALMAGGIGRRIAANALAQGVIAGGTDAAAQAVAGQPINPLEVTRSGLTGLGFGAFIGAHGGHPTIDPAAIAASVAEGISPHLQARAAGRAGAAARPAEGLNRYLQPMPDPRQPAAPPPFSPDSIIHSIYGGDPVLLEGFRARKATQAAVEQVNAKHTETVSQTQARLAKAQAQITEAVNSGQLDPKTAEAHLADAKAAAQEVIDLSNRDTQSRIQALQTAGATVRENRTVAPTGKESLQVAPSPEQVLEKLTPAPAAQAPEAPLPLEVTQQPKPIDPREIAQEDHQDATHAVGIITATHGELPALDVLESLGLKAQTIRDKYSPTGSRRVKIGGKRITFQPGDSFDLFLRRAKAKGIDPEAALTRHVSGQARAVGVPVIDTVQEHLTNARELAANGPRGEEAVQQVDEALTQLGERQNARAERQQAHETQKRMAELDTIAHDASEHVRMSRDLDELDHTWEQVSQRIQHLSPEEQAYIHERVAPDVEHVTGRLTGEADAAHQAQQEAARQEEKAGGLQGAVPEMARKALGPFPDLATYHEARVARAALPSKEALRAEYRAKVQAAGLGRGGAKEKIALTGHASAESYAKQHDPAKQALDAHLSEVHPNLKGLGNVRFDPETGHAVQSDIQPEQQKLADVYKDIPPDQRPAARVFEEAMKAGKKVEVPYAAEREGHSSTYQTKAFSPTHFFKAKNGEVFVDGLNDQMHPAKMLLKAATETDSGLLGMPKVLEEPARLGPTANVYHGPREFSVADVLAREPREEAIKHSEVWDKIGSLAEFAARPDVPESIRAHINEFVERGTFEIKDLNRLTKALEADSNALAVVCKLFGI